MTVLDGDSDFRRCLKPSALFRYVEQVSADHARAYGMDHAFFRERRSAFLVGKQALRVWRMPGRAEKIDLTTACEAFKKGTMKRLTTITSETGEKLALVDCRWMIVDTETGRILRTPGWTMPDFQNDDLPEELPQIVHKSQPLTAAGERRASYSMCDLNGHINNSLYLDIACDALPQEVLRLFGEWAHPTGLQHGTVTVVSGGLPIELTTMRRDGAYRDNRHPDSVTFGTSIEEDLARRDFTVNAIALSPDGTLVDPCGGQEDLKAGVLRCVGEPKRRFEEDALRILRLVRFCSVLGFAAEKETARAAHEARGLLAHVAHERVYTEMNKLLLGENVGETLLTFPDILGVPIPEILPCVGFDQCNYHHCFDVWGHTARAVAAVPPKRELRWTMLFHDLGKPLCRTFDEQGVGHFYGHTAISAQMAEDIMARLHFEKALRDRIRAQLACFDDMFRPERAAIHKEMARLGAETVQNLLYTKQADNAAKAPAGLERAQALWHEAQKIYDELISEGACCSIHELKISGEDLAALGYHGREIGAVLARLLDEVASEKLKNTPAALRVRAVRLWRSGYARHTMKENETH